MALREFNDEQGVRWKAWDVTSDQIHPKTRAEDYMKDLAEGWLVFERGDGEEKRRLYPCPDGWERLAEPELCTLCDQAEKVKRRPTPPDGVWKIGDTPASTPPYREHDAAATEQRAHDRGGGEPRAR